MKNEFKISVIVPIYNAELYISRCVESILQQTYSNLQIILIDDGSNDRSGEICDRYVKLDGRIEVYHTANRGLVAARKLGISHSEGEYIGFVDADDYVEEDMFESLLKAACESNADFVHTGYIEETEKEKREVLDFEDELLALPSIKKREDVLIGYVLQAGRGRHISNGIWSKLFKRELISKCYLYLSDEQQLGEDLLCLCLCILESERIQLTKCALYHYVVQKNSLCHLDAVDYIIEKTKLNYNIIKILQDYNKCVYERIKEHISYYLENIYLDMIKAVTEGKMHIPCFYFNGVDDLKGKKIIIYGAGGVGQDYYLQLCKYEEIEIVAWLDSNWQKYLFDYACVRDISILSNCEYDKIIIAVRDEAVAKEIENMLIGSGQPENKIFWEKPENILEKPKISEL